MYNIIIKPEAEFDATIAAIWYNKKRDGLGNEFLLSLDAIFNTIGRNPNQFQIIHNNIRRALTARFPFGVFFIVENKTIYVLAVLHTSKNPTELRGRTIK